MLTGALAPRASAQDNALGGAIVGGGFGAIIGGAATGKAGGAVAGGIIGAAAGAPLGSQFEQRGDGYYWYHGRCYRAGATAAITACPAAIATERRGSTTRRKKGGLAAAQL